MSYYIETICIFEYITEPKILIFYSPNKQLDVNEFNQIIKNEKITNYTNGLNSPNVLTNFIYNNYEYNIVSKENKFYCLVTKQEYPRRLVYNLLQELETFYNSIISESEFKSKSKTKSHNQIMHVCASLMNKYNDPGAIDKLTGLQNKVDNVKTIMHTNINNALINIDKLESIENKSKELEINSIIFKKNTKELKNKMWWKNIKMKLIIGTTITIIIGIIITICVLSIQNN